MMLEANHNQQPVLKSENYIIQPNRIIQTKFRDYTLLMHKIITAIAFELYKDVQSSMQNRNATQLDIFKQNTDIVYLKIPYSNVIKTPSHYEGVRKALKMLATKVVEIPYKHPKTGNEMLRITGLLKANIPINVKRCSFIEIEMEKQIVELFVIIDKNNSNIAINYTKYLYEIVQNSTSRYTPILYKLLASWKAKQVYSVTLEELKAQLDIKSTSYKRYFDFKRKVLMPIQNDLKDKADLWFDCNLNGFCKEKNGQLWLIFKIITPADVEQENTDRRTIVTMLKNNGFDDIQIKALDVILNNINFSRELFLRKITSITENIYNHNKDPSKQKIINQPAYMLTSLLNYFK